jgi:hypothetical protein
LRITQERCFHLYKITKIILHFKNVNREGPNADCSVAVIMYIISDAIRYKVSDISGSDCDGYEDDCLLGCSTV